MFKVTWGLQREFGSDRVFNSPLAEANIVGRAIGMALRGLKPVVEIQFFDYIWPAYQQIRNELATMRWRSNNAFTCPVVIRDHVRRLPVGRRDLPHPVRAHRCSRTPRDCASSARRTPLDANGLLRTAIRCDDPVLFLEHKHLYRQTYNKGPYPGPDLHDPVRQGEPGARGRRHHGRHLRRAGPAHPAGRAPARARGAGSRPRSSICARSRRCDWEAIAESVKQTNQVLVAYEDSLSWGYGAEIAARIADELFEWLDAPVRRLAATDTFVGYAPELEDEILPQVPDIAAALEELKAY